MSDPGAIFYVYVLFRPWDGSPFYVGKGKGNRWLNHDGQRSSHPNRYLLFIVRKARRLNLEIPKIKLREGLSEADAFAIERALIGAIGRKDQGRGPLANMTDGGEGSSNPSSEIRAKIGARSSAMWAADRERLVQINRDRNYSPSPEVRERVRVFHTGRAQSEETRAKLRGKIRSPETRAKLSRAMVGNKHFLGHKHSRETKEKLSRAHRGKKLTPEHRAKLSEARKRNIRGGIRRRRQSVELRLNPRIGPEQQLPD